MPVSTVRSQRPPTFQEGQFDYVVLMSNNIYTLSAKGLVGLASGRVVGALAASAISPDGSRYALCTTAANTTITIYPADYYPFGGGGGPTLTLPTVAGQVKYMAFSPGDGRFLAVAHLNSPTVSIYDTATNTKLANPGTLPTGNGRTVAWTADGGFLMVGHTSTPFATYYQVKDLGSGTPTFTKLTNPGTLPNAGVAGFAVFPPNQHGTQYVGLFTGSGGFTVNSIQLVTIVGTTVTFRQTVANLEDQQDACASPDGSRAGGNAQGGLGNRSRIFRLTATNTLTLETTIVPAGTAATGFVFTGDGRTCITTTDASPFIEVWSLKEPNLATVLPNPGTLPSAVASPINCWQNVTQHGVQL